METVAELMILAMSMFLAAFFCLTVLVIPENTTTVIEKIYEVEDAISEKRPSTR